MIWNGKKEEWRRGIGEENRAMPVAENEEREQSRRAVGGESGLTARGAWKSEPYIEIVG